MTVPWVASGGVIETSFSFATSLLRVQCSRRSGSNKESQLACSSRRAVFIESTISGGKVIHFITVVINRVFI